MNGKTSRMCAIAMMTALVFVSNYLRFPLLDSKITAANAVCLLSGLILGPAGGFLSAGLGSFLYDLTAGYGIEGLITLVSKGAMALIAACMTGVIRKKGTLTGHHGRLICGCVLGALGYVALYMLKTFLFGLWVNGLTLQATWIKMGTKLPASLINAGFASVVTPLFFLALFEPLRKLRVIKM